MSEQPDYDVVITGAGLIGASLGCALAGHGLRVAVVEARALDPDGLRPELSRSLALSLATWRILDGLGLLERIAGLATPIEHVHVSDHGHFGKTRMSAAETGLPALGYVMPSGELTVGLWQGLQDSGVDIIAPVTVGAVEIGTHAARLALSGDGPESVTARLVVAADGSHSPIRGQLGVEVRRRDFRQTALVTTIATEAGHGNTAFERFTPEGTVALLPFRDRMGLVWTVPSARADLVSRLDDTGFAERVQALFGDRLGRFSDPGVRGLHPLQQIEALTQVRPRVAIMGNAAHTLHPVAAQGFNLGLRDVAWLAQAVVEAWRAGGDPGDIGVLGVYADSRRADQRRVAAFSGSLVDLFSSTALPVVTGRNLALTALQVLPPVRHRLMRAAMGIDGRQPRLAMGLGL